VKRKRKREDEGLEGLRYEEVRRERTKKKRMPLRQPVMQKSNKQKGGGAPQRQPITPKEGKGRPKGIPPMTKEKTYKMRVIQEEACDEANMRACKKKGLFRT